MTAPGKGIETSVPTVHFDADARTRLVDAIRKAGKGDLRALPAVREAFDASPALWRALGDLATTAEQALIQAACGDDLAFREGLSRTVAALRADLAGPAPSPLERLLVDRIVACWLALHYAEAAYAQHMHDLNLKQAEFHQQRIDRAHRRYLGAIRTLAQVRRLLTPAMQVNIAERQINVAG